MERLTNDKFILNAKLKHGETYLYDDINIINSRVKIKIKCKKHGDFEQTPVMHLRGQGCPKCKFEKISLFKRENNKFIEKSNHTHKNFYGYDKVDYINNKTKVIITCPIHGDFEQIPYTHLDGSGCKKCKGRLSTNTKEFIEQSEKIHNDNYSYNKTIYNHSKKEVIITCLTHGDFKQIPNTHLMGHGCPKCNLFGTVSENRLFNELKINFSDLEIINKFSAKWLGRQHLDIFIPSLNIAIEYQGGQHFKPIKFFGGEKEFEKILKRDENKRKKCEMKKIKLLYFSYDVSYVPKDYSHTVYSDEKELFNQISLEL